jgi:hypothetical protein
MRFIVEMNPLQHASVVLTNDLDVPTIAASTTADGPGVVLLRRNP